MLPLFVIFVLFVVKQNTPEPVKLHTSAAAGPPQADQIEKETFGLVPIGVGVGIGIGIDNGLKRYDPDPDSDTDSEI